MVHIEVDSAFAVLLALAQLAVLTAMCVMLGRTLFDAMARRSEDGAEDGITSYYAEKVRGGSVSSQNGPRDITGGHSAA